MTQIPLGRNLHLILLTNQNQLLILLPLIHKVVIYFKIINNKMETKMIFRFLRKVHSLNQLIYLNYNPNRVNLIMKRIKNKLMMQMTICSKNETCAYLFLY